MRKTVLLNMDWKFCKVWEAEGIGFPFGCEYEEFDDSGWQTVQAPHDYSITAGPGADNFGQNAWTPGGIGWYRRSITLDLAQGGAVELQVDGAYRDSAIWLNGEYVGGQKNGFFSNLFDLSPYARRGDNLLVIRTANTGLPNCRWYTGSGLYRNVWLHQTQTTRLETWGVRVATPEVSADRAQVLISAAVTGPDAACVSADFHITDTQGREVAFVRGVQAAESGVSAVLTVERPGLWSPDTPSMYSVLVTLSAGGKILDQIKTDFGIRSIEYRKREGFLLNGVPTKFKGVCLHQDAGPLGNAVPDQIWEQRFTELKRIGCNAVRTSHQPPSPEFLNLCDRMGFLVMNEFCDKWEPPHYLDFMRNWRDDIAAWIARDFNHPSVVMWSTGNENYRYPDTPYIRKHLKMIGEEVRRHDVTRPVMNGLERGKDLKDGGGSPEDYAKRLMRGNESMDFHGVNYADQWYDIMLELDPDALILGTENYDYITSAPDDRHKAIEYHSWLYVEKDPRVMGMFNWLGIDYLGEASKSNFTSLGSRSGIIDIIGQPKPAAALYESFWSDKPMVSIAVYRQDPEDMQRFGLWGWPSIDQHWHASPGAVVDVVTYTNCEEVELLCNGRIIGRQRLSDIENRIMKWRLPFERGRVEAVGYCGGIERARFALDTPGEAAKLEITPSHTHLAADGTSMAVIHVKLLDKHGVHCCAYEQIPVSFTTSGPGRVECVHNGNMGWHGPFYSGTVPVHKGCAAGYIRAGFAAGDLTVTASAPELPDVSCTIRIG